LQQAFVDFGFTEEGFILVNNIRNFAAGLFAPLRQVGAAPHYKRYVAAMAKFYVFLAFLDHKSTTNRVKHTLMDHFRTGIDGTKRMPLA